MEETRVIKGYELRERIGSGGFGVVHRAYQSTLGREVAIKIILPHFANHPDFIRRFETEAQLIARLEHPHIVPLYDYWRDPSGAFLVMRWLRGGSLRDALQQGPLELDTTALLLDQITSALALAHRSGVIHRDLKPANILLDEDSNAYLSDFGIAKDFRDVQGSQTGTDVILGSPDYLSPEQARSEPVTPQTDIYSLGVMLYEILTGEHPFPGKTAVERIYKHLNDPLPIITTLPKDMSEGVNAIIQKATAKNPAQRYGDVFEVAAAFHDEIALSHAQVGTSLVEQLTLREQEILQLITEGRSNREIAERLFVTPGTVKWYIWQLYRKLRVRSRVQAIVRARELDLIVPAISTEAGVTEATYVPLPEPENPYKGLRAFQTADARDFFGREKLIQKLVARLKEKNSLARFLAVVGPSGSGKSSVVKAGLVPALWRGELSGSDRWFVVEVVPGARPLDELEIALTRVAANPISNLREHLERDQYGLLRVSGLILPDDGSDLVFIIDQFEEVFTLVDDEIERTHFLNLIQAAVTDPRSRVRVIITLRADFYDRPLHYPEFGELVRNRMETVMPLSADELEAAIARPAQRVGISFEPGLVATITSDVHYQPGALPLLQYALTELFEQRNGRTLTKAAYDSLGGTVGALAKRADDIYIEQDEEGRDAIRQMFLRLVTVGEDVEDTRRRVSRAELLAVASNSDVMDELIDTYAAYRLLTLDHDPATRRPTVEIAHEAILREWQRLRLWLDESRHDIRQQRLLAVAAAEWQRASCDESYLLTGTRLEQFAGWATETRLALTQHERTFLENSITEHARQETDERTRQARELALQKRAANHLRYLVAALMVFLVGALVLTALALEARSTAQRQRDKAEREAAVNHSLVLSNSAQQKFNNGNPDLALALALEAVHMDQPPTEALSTLTTVAFGPGTRDRFVAHPYTVRSVTFSPDGQLGISTSCAERTSDLVCTGGEMGLWDLQTHTELRRFGGLASGGHTDWITDAVFSSDGKSLLSSSEDGTAILWNVETGEVIRRFEGHSNGVNSIALSTDGRTFLSGSDDTTIILWDIETGEILRRFEGHIGAVNSVVFSPDGQRYASGSDDTTIIYWDVNTGEIIQRLEGHTDKVNDLAFRPTDANILFSVGMDFMLRMWNLDAGKQIHEYNFALRVDCIAITPDGRTAAICAEFGLRTWDIDQRIETYRFVEEQSTKTSIAMNAAGSQILAGSESGVIRYWNLGVTPEVRRFGGDGMLFGAGIAVSPDETLILTGLFDGTAILWDARSGTEVRRLEGLAGQVLAAEFSPDGCYALIGHSDWVQGTGASGFLLWDVQTGEVVYRLEGNLFLARSLAFSPDGHMALTGSQKYPMEETDAEVGDLILWDMTTGQQIRRFEMTQDITSIVFSADASRALTSSTRPTDVITLWDVSTGQPIRRFKGGPNSSGMFGVVFGPGEQTALGAAGEGTLYLWDIETGASVRRFSGHEDWVFSLDISADKRHIISVDDRGTIILWDFETGQELRRFATTPGVANIVFSSSGQMAYSAPFGGTAVVQWQISGQSLDELLDWIQSNRYTRDFTCDEREQYRIEPLCE